MPLSEKNHLRQFLLLVFVLLIPCFAIWSFFSAALVTPVIGLTNLVLSSWFPDIANFFWGLLVIYLFISLGLICICLKDLMVTFGTTFLEQPGVLVPGPDVIGIAYQLSALIVPTLVPVLVWAWQSQETPLLRGLLGTQASAADENPGAG